MSTGRGVVWVTKGREIENYVPHSQLQEAVKIVYSKSYARPCGDGQFDHALYFRQYFNQQEPGRTDGRTRLQDKIDKVKVARLVCEKPADFSILDLRKKVGEIVKMIEEAND